MIAHIHQAVLGSAQLRMPYGIANRTGAPPEKESFKILQTAWKFGIRYFDAAPDYNSESFIGNFIQAEGLQKEIHILTKIPSFGHPAKWKELVTKYVTNSLANLRCSQIEVLFFHNPQDAQVLLREPEYFAELMCKFPIRTLGISVYDPNEIDKVKDCGLDLAFQFPFNLLDRRFENNSIAMGKRYARSIFLQGLLASPTLIEMAPDELKRFHSLIWEDCEKNRIVLIQQALKFVLESSCLDFFLFGVESVAQLRQLLKTDLTPEINLPLVQKWRSLVNPNWLDPRTWTS